MAHAEVSTIGGRASDVFYLTDTHGMPLDRSEIEHLRDEMAKVRSPFETELMRSIYNRISSWGVTARYGWCRIYPNNSKQRGLTLMKDGKCLPFIQAIGLGVLLSCIVTTYIQM